MNRFRLASKALCLALALGLAVDGTVATAADAPADPAATGAAPKKAPKLKTVCTQKSGGQKVCRKVSSADPQVAKSSGFFQSVGAPLAVGGAGITAAAASKGKNCGRGNNSQNNGNCAASP